MTQLTFDTGFGFRNRVSFVFSRNNRFAFDSSDISRIGSSVPTRNCKKNEKQKMSRNRKFYSETHLPVVVFRELCYFSLSLHLLQKHFVFSFGAIADVNVVRLTPLFTLIDKVLIYYDIVKTFRILKNTN